MAAPRSLLGLAVFTALLMAVPAQPAAAREDRREQRRAAAEPAFPDATREEPRLRSSPRLQRQLSQLVEAYNEGDTTKARELADAILANERANAYDISFAAQVAASAASDQDDLEAAIAYMERVIETNGLDNEGHYNTMQNLAVAQLNSDQPAAAVATLTRLINETQTRNPVIHHTLGSAYFRAEQFAEAAAALRKAISLSPEPRTDWLRLLQAALIESGETEAAVAVGQQVLAKTPDDKQAVFALASNFIDLERYDDAIRLLEDARTRGLFNEARDYRTLYSLYFNVEGRERDVIAVIEEGFAKGVLPRDLQSLSALAQAAYFSDDMTRAIAAYREAAALDPRGESGLNYAKVLSAEGLDAEARAAARAALAKGLQRPGEAWMVIARAESQIGTPAEVRAALQEAARFPETAEQANRMLRQNR